MSEGKDRTTEKAAYGISELARRFGVSEGFLRSEIAVGRLRVRRAGRRVLVLASDFDSYLETYWKSPTPKIM